MDMSEVHPHSCLVGTVGALMLGLNWLENDRDHRPPSSAGVNVRRSFLHRPLCFSVRVDLQTLSRWFLNYCYYLLSGLERHQ
jgi:hypothetical protein